MSCVVSNRLANVLGPGEMQSSARRRFAICRSSLPPKRKIKRCALVFFCLRPDPSAMPSNDAINECQAHAGAFEFTGPVQALKNAKQLVGMFHLETDAVIPDEDGSFVIDFGLADLD